MNYLDKIEREPIKLQYSKEDLLKEDYLITSDKNLEIYYAPFDYINLNASVIIVGITPGWTQMEQSFRTLIRALHENKGYQEALKKVKSESSFAGSMRVNLINMLDELNLDSKLGLNSTSELFDENNTLLHSTSAIRYPVFKNGTNYTGSSPSPIKNKTLWEFVVNYLVPELNSFSNKLIIPLGKKIDEIFVELQSKKLILNNNCILHGFPHPSGGNGHRKKQFEANKNLMSEVISSWINE